VGFVGLMVGGLIAANSSTLLTLLNWGASYLVHDFYQRFVKPGASEKHYVMTARVATVVLFLFSSAVVYAMNSAKNAFDLMLQIGAGTGLLYLLRWFWWRISAWCEVVAMISSFAASITLLVLNKNGANISTDHALLITVLVTTVCWVATAFIGPQTDRTVLVEFYKRVGPFGPGWETIRKQAGLPKSNSGENIPLAMLGWSSGCALIWSALFAIGNYLYGRTNACLGLTAVAVVTALILIWTVNRLWSTAPNHAESVSKATTANV
jgi:SSS family solute:Na+ symporter